MGYCKFSDMSPISHFIEPGSILKKCCLVNFHGDWGGAEKVAIEVIKVLKQNYTPTLVTAFSGDFTDRFVSDESINVHTLQKGSARLEGSIIKILYILVFGLQLRKFVKNGKFELLYLNNQVAIVTSIFMLGYEIIARAYVSTKYSEKNNI